MNSCQCFRCNISASKINEKLLLKGEILHNILKDYLVPLETCHEIIKFLHKDFYSFIYPVLFVDYDCDTHVETSYYKPKAHILCPSCFKFGILRSYARNAEFPTGHNQGYNICKRILRTNENQNVSFRKVIHKFMFPSSYSCEYHVHHELKKDKDLIYIS